MLTEDAINLLMLLNSTVLPLLLYSVYKLYDISNTLGKMTNQNQTMGKNIANLSEQISEHSKRIENHEHRISTVERKLMEIEGNQYAHYH